MKLKTVLLLIGFVFLANFIIGKIFKVNYSGENVIVIDNIKVNDSISVKDAYVVLGKNYKGFIEATIFPRQEQRFRDQGVIEYYYLRFHPDWYKTNILPGQKRVIGRGSKLGGELIRKAKNAHETNFSYCCHFNDYPLVLEGLSMIRISLYGVADKIYIW